MSEFGYNYTQMGTIIPGGSSITNISQNQMESKVILVKHDQRVEEVSSLLSSEHSPSLFTF